MKVLHLSTSDIDGGAARAAYRLHQGMKPTVSSQMLVRAKDSVDKAVTSEKSLLTKLGPPSSGWPLKLYPKRDRILFSTQWFPDAIAPKVKQINPDIINLHWICNGFLQIESLAKLNKPLVWTLHDMWPFTGGCHYSEDCDRYIQSCGACPQLKSSQNWDLSRWIWQRKAKTLQKLNLTIVSPSHWLAECAQSSSLLGNFQVEVIPHGLDLETYKPIEQEIAQKLLNLPQDKQLVLFGASPGTTGDRRKGLYLLQPALKYLSQSGWQDKLELVVFGDSRPDNSVDLDFNIHYLGQFQDDISLALVYSAADVMVVPSMQEAFGQTASEALACGTSVVAFDATGLKDIVDHKQNGYLVKPFDVEGLAQGIAWVLEDGDRHRNLSINAREKANREFSLGLQTSRYLSLYDKILSKDRNLNSKQVSI
jgi:glycosyltransferase involved in cell wall biosynthesis